MRAFVAINLPDPERVRLHASLAPLRALSLPVRWLPPGSLHITLKFLGEIDEAQVARVEEALGQVAAEVTAFDIEAGGVGAFPNLSRPRVWWLGVKGHVRLTHAQSAVEAALASAGYRREERPFSPHITIGRTRPSARRLRAPADDAIRRIDYSARIHVASIDLMESRLSAEGARYTCRVAADLLPAVAAPRARTPAPSAYGESGATPLRPEAGGREGGEHHGEPHARLSSRASIAEHPAQGLFQRVRFE